MGRYTVYTVLSRIKKSISIPTSYTVMVAITEIYITTNVPVVLLVSQKSGLVSPKNPFAPSELVSPSIHQVQSSTVDDKLRL